MRKITKLMMAATLGLAIASSALVFNPVKTEAKTTYVTTTTAAKKIVALQKKAYNSKKKVSSKTEYWKIRYIFNDLSLTSFLKFGCGRKLFISDPNINSSPFL